MKQAIVKVHDLYAGILSEKKRGASKNFEFEYAQNYTGEPVSLTMPINQHIYKFETFPPFFEGLLPEGVQLEGLLRIRKIDRNDYFSQLLAIGADTVGAVTIFEK